MAKLDLTKSKEDVEKDVRAKLKKRKAMRKDLLRVSVLNIVGNGVLADTTIKKIGDYRGEAYEKYRQWTDSVDPKKIRIRFENEWADLRRGILIFYINIPESDDMFERRVNTEVKRIMKQIHNRKKDIAREEKEQKDKKRKAAIAAIKELGDEVYDVFEEIIKNDT